MKIMQAGGRKVLKTAKAATKSKIRNNDDSTNNNNKEEEAWTRAMAIRTKSFWVITLALQIISGESTSLFFWLSQILEEVDFSAKLLSTLYLVVSISSVLSGVVAGIALDRVPCHHIVAFGLFLQFLVMLGVAIAPTRIASLPPMLVIMGLQGIANSIMMNAIAVVYAQYFGRAHLGAISGLGFSVIVIGSATGPFPLALGRDVLGNYTTPCLLLAVVPLVFAVAVLCYGAKPKMETRK
eukprot:c4244_g1_i1.p1 GENE.c4244_g1_i1~~c4244_g1_i1.p1  ORF type:complete len:280 (-),score=88.76 c4244_g1_i1:483-1199(-)